MMSRDPQLRGSGLAARLGVIRRSLSPFAAGPAGRPWGVVGTAVRRAQQLRPAGTASSFEVGDAVSYGRGLRGLGVNLLVAESCWPALLTFVREVLRVPLATVGENFAVLRHGGTDMILHRDDTYGSSPGARAERQRAAPGPRGLGVELRIYSVNPGEVEARARAAGHTVLQPTATKPHGLVECYLQGPGGYVWVPSCPTKEEPEPGAEEDKGG